MTTAHIISTESLASRMFRTETAAAMTLQKAPPADVSIAPETSQALGY
jgi:hypothetical protein